MISVTRQKKKKWLEGEKKNIKAKKLLQIIVVLGGGPYPGHSRHVPFTHVPSYPAISEIHL